MLLNICAAPHAVAPCPKTEKQRRPPKGGHYNFNCKFNCIEPTRRLPTGSPALRYCCCCALTCFAELFVAPCCTALVFAAVVFADAVLAGAVFDAAAFVGFTAFAGAVGFAG